MHLIKRYLKKQRFKKEERNRKCNELIAQFSNAVSEAYNYFTDKSGFIEITLAVKWNEKYGYLQSSSTRQALNAYRKANMYPALLKKVDEYANLLSTLRHKIEEHNEHVAGKKVYEAYNLIGYVEGRRLDNQQMLCIVKESHNHLIIAGAGTGKTTTIVGRIKYLIKSGRCKPEDILVLSFTNASAAEMKERIHKETNCDIAVSTFHKLGLNIITEAEGVKPRITKVDLRRFVKEKLQDLIQDPQYVAKLSIYLLFHRVAQKSEFEFKNEREYNEYLQINPPVTILNEKVKSYGEMDIANFLFQNRIKYEYEPEYKFDTRTREYSQYHPDFYLPEYDIYIEYFGINRKGEVPPWFAGDNKKSATQAYQESMAWKRRIHAEKKTKLIECFSYEKMEGTLLENLENNLKKYGVVFSPMPPEELWRHVSHEGGAVIDGLVELFVMVINLVKSNHYTLDCFRTIAAKSAYAIKHLAFMDLLQPIFEEYNSALNSSGEIDFNDMINRATQYIREGRYHSLYSYVIVDEYQDISKSRFMLLNELRNVKDYDLFCVGDDWQSIYRFTGSDISYILNFEHYWGPTTISKIETTYRFTKSLIDISGSFIMQNPAQIRKQIRVNSTDTRFSLEEINVSSERNAANSISDIIKELPKDSTVFYIGRYNHDVNLLKESFLFECEYNNASELVEVRYRKRKDLRMCFLTAHKSKGLEADYVFIINNKDSRMGFPSKIQDDSILSLLLSNYETYPFAEERRLFYVALTRARKKVYLLNIRGRESVFVQEIRNRYLKVQNNSLRLCPVCGGKMIRKSGRYGEFFGCENYRKTGCRYKADIRKKS